MRGNQGSLSCSPSLLASHGDHVDKVAVGSSPPAHATLVLSRNNRCNLHRCERSEKNPFAVMARGAGPVAGANGFHDWPSLPCTRAPPRPHPLQTSPAPPPHPP